MSLGSLRALLLFMIFIMDYISKFLPDISGSSEDDEKKVPDLETTTRFWSLF